MNGISHLLDDSATMLSLDRQGMLSILARFDQQVEEALQIGQQAVVPFEGNSIKNILLSGLGGSAIGGDFLRAFLGKSVSIPLQVNRNYELPCRVDASTLVLICSYSGNTEETISAFQEAHQAGARIVCVTSNGEIQKLAETKRHPLIKIPAGYPPRTALGYSTIPLLVLFSRLGIAPDASKEIRQSLESLRRKIAAYGPDTPLDRNSAKQLALQLYGRLPVIYGSQNRLEMVAIRWRGQFSENAKVLAYSSFLPEMNHNELVGWKHPEKLLGAIVPIFLRDREDLPRVQIRLDFTRDVLRQKANPVLEYWSEGESWLERLWSLILLGDYASVYLAFLNGEDPTPVEIIEMLKKRLKESQ